MIKESLSHTIVNHPSEVGVNSSAHCDTVSCSHLQFITTPYLINLSIYIPICLNKMCTLAVSNK